MKKKVVLLCAVAAMGIAAAVGVSLQNRAQLSDVALANIEALASGEDLGEVTITCGQYDGPCWKEIRDENERPTGKCEWSGYQLDTCYPANH